jgi:hypothetical protein
MKWNKRARDILALTVALLFMAGAASATTFPVDEAGIAAYVNVSDTIDLDEAMINLQSVITEVVELNTTYFIVNVTNDDNQNTHLYVGADGWVIPYYLNTEPVSRVVRWNITSDQDPTPQNVTNMTTLEEVISKTCDAIGVDYETIESEIKFYDFKHPDANRMTIVVDMLNGGGTNTFYMTIPSEVTLNESTYSHYMRNTATRWSQIAVDETSVSYRHIYDGERTWYDSYGLTLDVKHTIKLQNQDSYVPVSGVGWVLVYQR